MKVEIVPFQTPKADSLLQSCEITSRIESDLARRIVVDCGGNGVDADCDIFVLAVFDLEWRGRLEGVSSGDVGIK